MRRSAFFSRLALLTTLATIAAGLVGTTPVLAADPVARDGRHARFTGDGDRHVSRQPASKLVTVRDLPAAEGPGTASEPRLLKRETSVVPKAPTAPLAPVTVTASGDGPATEAETWDGVGRTLPGEPPDPWIAAGPEHVVQAVNTKIRITDRTGVVASEVDTLDFFDAVGFAPMSPFDPRVIYDSLHGRWIAIAAHWDCEEFPDEGVAVGVGWLDIAVSQSADPTGAWEVLHFGFADALPDYPGIGTSTDKVVLSSNLFQLVPAGGVGCAAAGFLTTELDAMAWTELTDPNSPLNIDFFFGGSDFPNNFFTWRPALQTPAITSNVFVIGEGLGGAVTYTRLTGNPATASTVLQPFVNLGSAGIDPFELPPAPRQPGVPATIVDAVDQRPTDAVWQNSRLAVVSTYPCDPAGGVVEDRDCVRVSELSTSNTSAPTKVQDILISEEDADLYMGGIGYAGNGDLHVVWTRSSENAGDYPSSYAAHQLVTDANNKLSQPQLLKAGTDTYDGTRWGDYVGVAQDPQVPNAVWQANEYSVGNGWATDVSQLQTGGSSYVPITPKRVVDSRFNTGVTGIFVANTPKSFSVAGVAPIPANAIAVTGNVTVTNQTAAGFVSVTPTATSTPPSSTLNFPVGDVRANNFTASLDSAGRLAAVYKAVAGKQTHIVVDITGFFLPGDEDATYTAATPPIRVMDTRPATHVGSASIFENGVTQTLQLAGTNGIPADATAITGNLTVVLQTKAGYLSVTPDDPVGVPPSSTLNFPVGDVRANGLTADLNGVGALSITYTAVPGATTHVVLDVTGYYVEGDASGKLFFPLNPGRVLDSRPGVRLSGLSGTFAGNVPRTLEVGTHWGVPGGATAITGNLTVVGQTAAGFVAVTPTPDADPDTSTLNFPLGDVRANGVTVPLSSDDLSLVYKAGSARTTHLVLDVTGYFK
jgi:hypothetical protein